MACTILPKADLPFGSASWRGQRLSERLIVEGAPSSDHAGLGVHVAPGAAICRGEIVYRERPLIFVQSDWSARAVPSCLHCGALLGGTLGDALVRLSARGMCSGPWPQLHAAGLLDSQDFALPIGLPCPSAAAEPDDAAQRVEASSGAACDDASCDCRFCSEACRDAAMSGGHHRLLCESKRRAPWAAFRRHAVAHHETFLLAGLLLAQAIVEMIYGASSLEEVLARYFRFASRPWPEMLPPTAREREKWVAHRWSTLEASLALLLAVIEDVVPPGLEVLFTCDGYAELVGMLDMTTKDLTRPNPLDGRLKAALDEAPVQARTELGAASLAWMRSRHAAEDTEEPNSPETSDSEDEKQTEGQEKRTSNALVDLVELSKRARELPVLPGFEGFGLVRTVALTNHSCCGGNVDVVSSVYTVDVVACAVRDLPEGEELTMSYIDETEPVAKRQRALLATYGFQCRCDRCQADLATAA
eukprot:TRINITY_DN33284_c0_g1_i1.p1 TRINITY_DN33284_c0_g1~~TRINITY_DN33284_c0_g1_i1.p1  ORF type:complete len:513 (-),score=91.08 TRINITY_DN33284_c0_g1_i1:46-1467(-)